jgi:hypothetical protein
MQKPGSPHLVAAGVLLCGVWGAALAQNTTNPGWSAVEQGAKQFVVETYKVEAPMVNIMPMDSRIKFEPCTQDIQFDQPFGNKQSVRARCANRFGSISSWFRCALALAVSWLQRLKTTR